MVERVFIHIGLPKTGTTYLQKILWSNREALEADGVTLPGPGHRRHLWAALDLQDFPHLERRHEEARGTWERFCAELDEASGTGLFTHEFHSLAEPEHVARAVERLAPAEVHVIVTARHAAGMLAGGWQETVKNGGQLTLAEVADNKGFPEFSWRAWDLADVLARWSSAIPPERIHVLPMPLPGRPPEEHWANFASVLGLSGDYELPEHEVNRSLGAVQVELLRRINAHLDSFRSAYDRGHWIRRYLAEGQLADQEGDRFGLDEELLEDCRRRSREAVRVIREGGYDVVGDVETLLVPEDAAPRRSIDSVTETELVDSAAQLIASLMDDVRELSEAAETPDDPTPAPPLPASRRILGFLRGSGSS